MEMESTRILTQASELIEFTPTGQFVGQLSLDATQGAAFGLALNVIQERPRGGNRQ